MRTKQGLKNKISYDVFFARASKELKEKLLILKNNPDHALSKDADVVEFLKNVIDLSEDES